MAALQDIARNAANNTVSELTQAAQQELDRLAAQPTITLKDKLGIQPQEAAELDPVVRRTTMDETCLGFTEAQAKLEASRCMGCKKPFCTAACPIGMPVPQYLQKVAAGDFQGAIDIIRDTSLFPSICSRVCPHERQCQSNCAMGKSLKDPKKGIHLGLMERFCADYERLNLGGKKVPAVAPATGKKIAVIGSGPAGLSAAIDLRKQGHEVVIFESQPKLGGVLRYGIPEFRLPKEILDYELSIVEKMGIECRTGIRVFKDVTVDYLWKQGFDAIFVGIGAAVPMKLGIPGEDLKGVYTAEEYLRKGNNGEEIYSGKHVIIAGGGNVAMDAARMAYRLGAESVRIVYRRTLNEMPACRAEIKEVLDEGVKVMQLHTPEAFIPDEEGKVCMAKLGMFELGELDENGRPRPIRVKGDGATIVCDTAVIAIGSKVSPVAAEGIPGLETNKNGTFVVKDAATGETTVENVYTAGDSMHGPLTVVMAMKTGRQAAAAIHKKLMGIVDEPAAEAPAAE